MSSVLLSSVLLLLASPLLSFAQQFPLLPDLPSFGGFENGLLPSFDLPEVWLPSYM
jgi:hypothetical protein